MSIEMTAIVIAVIGLILLIIKRRALTGFVFGLGLGMLIAVEWVNILINRAGLR